MKVKIFTSLLDVSECFLQNIVTKNTFYVCEPSGWKLETNMEQETLNITLSHKRNYLLSIEEIAQCNVISTSGFATTHVVVSVRHPITY